MSTPAIIAVAITGSVPRKKDTPAVPVTPAEQVASTREAFEAGAALVHIHVRDGDENPSSEVERFAEVATGIREQCPGMIVQFSTGGRGRRAAERGAALRLRPDMASLATGSVNFASIIYENPPELVDSLAAEMLRLDIKPEIEVFDLAMLYTAAEMTAAGRIARPAHVQFVLGIPNALPARRRTLEFLVAELRELMPDATWTAAGIGRHQLIVNEWALEMGGHLRTGLEDNIRWDAGRLAVSNAELVARVADMCRAAGRGPATAAQARALLRLPSAPAAAAPSDRGG